MKKYDVYICTKPLQYLNICNIPVLDNNKRILIVCDRFYKASEFADNVRKYEKQWDKVILAEGRRKWISYVLRYRIDKLFFGMDTTAVGLLHFIKRFKFYLFEEGAGVYRHLKIQNKYKSIIKILGTGEIMGQSTYLKSIFVYYPSFYISQIHPLCKVSSFILPYRETIKQNVDKFLKLNSFDINKEPFLKIKNSKILIYLTDWKYQVSTIKKMEEQIDLYDYVFIKPHPHIRVESIPVVKGIDILYTNIVVEIVFQIWIEGNNKVTVYHQDSTAITPFGNELTTINVSEISNSEYSKIIEKLTSFSSTNK